MIGLCCCLGCGTTKSRSATEQLLMSDAIDNAIAAIDFTSLSGQKVYFDTEYVKNIKGFAFANSEYIISSLRQQMIAADCRLQAKAEDADFIVEARVGTVGLDGNEVVYGIPASNALNNAASLLPNAPAIPAIPEIAVARKQSELGAAKIAVFAFHRETGRPYWQSGLSLARSTSQDMWLFGAGPFQRGSIYDGTQFAGQRLRIPKLDSEGNPYEREPVPYFEEYVFEDDRRRAPLTIRSIGDSSTEEKPLVETAPGDWLTPLEPRVVSPLESRMNWR